MSEHAIAAELLHDPDAYARTLKQVHEAVLSGVPGPRSPRSVISASWDRSLAAHVDPDAMAPPLVYDSDELEEVRAVHPLSPVLPVLRQTLVSVADDAEHMMIVTDADGNILWREGALDVCHRADRVLLTEGAQWSEDVIGTNAMGTVLATGQPVQVYSAEHLVRTYHDWTCAAAPIRDPENNALIGAVDVSGPLHTVHPAMLALVNAAAGLAEGQLRAQLAVREENIRRRHMPHLRALRGAPGALLSTSGKVLATESCGPLPDAVDVRTGTVTLPDGRLGKLEPLEEGFLLRLRNGTPRSRPRPKLRLRFLTDEPPVASVDGREIPLTLRHAEILCVLAMHPHGMNAGGLALELYGEHGNAVTIRAEIHRLRAQLGAEIVRTRPYLLAADLDADFLRARDALRRGNVSALCDAFQGPLLDESEAPAIRNERESLTALTRRAVIDSDDADALMSYWDTSCGVDDIEVLEAMCDVLPGADPRVRIARDHLDRLLA